MDDVLVGLLAVGLGLAVCFLGLRVWFFMLPVWGFVAGFFVGAGLVTAVFGDGFLSTVTGWVVGFFAGLLFALVSFAFWYAGVLVAAASIGALLGSGLMAALDVDSGWIVFLVALAGAALFAWGAYALDLPIYAVIVNTALAGATAVVTGAMLVLDRIDLAQLEYGSAWAAIEESWFWLLVWVAVAALGIGAQLTAMANALFPEERWARAQTPGGTPGYAA